MKKKNEQNFREMWNHKCSKICVMGVSEEEKEKEKYSSQWLTFSKLKVKF